MTQLGLAARENPLQMKAIVLPRAHFPMLGKDIVKKTSNNKCQILIKSCYCVYFHWNSVIQSVVVRDEGDRVLVTGEHAANIV